MKASDRENRIMIDWDMGKANLYQLYLGDLDSVWYLTLTPGPIHNEIYSGPQWLGYTDVDIEGTFKTIYGEDDRIMWWLDYSENHEPFPDDEEDCVRLEEIWMKETR